MKIVLACDVDPVLPAVLRHAPDNDIWKCLDNIDDLIKAAGADLPPVTWLIRSDESVKFSTGDFASGYTAKKLLWQTLLSKGHELGWHMHLASFDARSGCFEFDPRPTWLADAYRALANHFDVRATRTGWDYASDLLFQRFESLGIYVDLSALPGNIVWQRAGHSNVPVNWLRCSTEPYHPNRDDYRRDGNLNLLEIPITQFPNSAIGMGKRMVWRLRNGCWSISGLGNKTKMLTEPWDTLPSDKGDVWAFYFHPEDLSGAGLQNGLRNLRQLRGISGVEFTTATAARNSLRAMR